jgi:hypothetical protein
MGCCLSVLSVDHPPPEAWCAHYNGGGFGDEVWAYYRRSQEAYRERFLAGKTVDERARILIAETDDRVRFFIKWALKVTGWAHRSNSSSDDLVSHTCKRPCLAAGVDGSVVWRGSKDPENPGPVTARAMELGWEPVQTRLNRLLAPATVTDCCAIKWNLGEQ